MATNLFSPSLSSLADLRVYRCCDPGVRITLLCGMGPLRRFRGSVLRHLPEYLQCGYPFSCVGVLGQVPKRQGCRD